MNLTQLKGCQKILNESYEKILFPLFDQNHHNQLLVDKFKHIFEINIILRKLSENGGSNVLDFGCGAGINVLLLSTLFDIRCVVVDRFDEFESEHKRSAGNIDVVISRLQNARVRVIRDSYHNLDMYNDLIGSFDIVSSFDVIEHLTESPYKYILKLNSLKKSSGNLIIGTPNQQHIYNRIKGLFGKNTWEDFDIWFECNYFYGHVRELIVDDLRNIARKYLIKPDGQYEIHSSNYVLRYRLSNLGAILDMALSKLSNLSYYIVLVA
jgi:2-polyprenyl-3-methyl-5-hydroxy-6-metoxy-1,4-benzoquinol methylase